ncbi:MAG: phosphopyruvate hydratase [Ruminococcaceae bacterium]|nr:phosphopyruvate hydratase [Oscillospiraceae bacterium]
MIKPQIIKCTGREILDSRGNPTVEATVVLSDGSIGVASVPSGASTGIFEAVEKRDGDKRRYGGKGVLEAVSGICRHISPEIVGCYASDQSVVDKLMRELDGTENKSKLGANAILAVSLANARACASSYQIPLFRWIGGSRAVRLPIPMMNILNGGAHASNNVEIQEFMIVPVGASSFADALRTGSEVYHSLGKILKSRSLSVSVGDEGGFAPDLESDAMAIELICEAIGDAGYSTDDVKIALDVASSEWYDEESGVYEMPKRRVKQSREDLISYYTDLVNKYPIISIEDPLDQRDFEGWTEITERLGDRVMLVGDDLFVTNPKRLSHGIEVGAANAILVKPNQIGTLSEVIEVTDLANTAGYTFILSHRSGETEDTTIADIAVGTGAAFIKSGAPCRSDRVAKYNRLLRIEASLGNSARYGLNNDRIDPSSCTHCGDQSLS